MTDESPKCFGDPTGYTIVLSGSPIQPSSVEVNGIKYLPTPHEDGWISVEERLPEVGVMVMAFVSPPGCAGIQVVAALAGNGDWPNLRNRYVTHWRPLPADPPAKKGEGR